MPERVDAMIGRVDAGAPEAALLRDDDPAYRRRRDGGPGAQALEDQTAAVRQRDRAWIMVGRAGLARVEHRDRVAVEPERQRRGEADRAGPGDYDRRGDHGRVVSRASTLRCRRCFSDMPG